MTLQGRDVEGMAGGHGFGAGEVVHRWLSSLLQAAAVAQ
jgi:hypothetical protein